MNKDKAQKRIIELRKELEYYAKKYYDEDAPEISDFEYDMMMNELKNLENEYPELITKESLTQKVGGTVKKGFAKPKNAKKTISRLLRYMGSYKYFWILVFICVLLSSGASVLGSYLIKPALNDYIIPLIGKQNPDFSGFLKLLAGVFCLFLVGVLASWINNRLMLHISTNLLFNVRIDLFSKAVHEFQIRSVCLHPIQKSRRLLLQKKFSEQ